MKTGLFDHLQNPRQLAVKRFLISVLNNRYVPYDDLITRLSTQLITDADLQSFGKFVNDVYETGYHKAMDDYKDQMSKFGVQVSFSPKTQDGSQ